MRRHEISKLASACKCFVIWAALQGCCAIANAQEQDKTGSYKVTSGDVIASVHATDLSGFQPIAVAYTSERTRLAADLVDVLHTQRLPLLNRCSAAYYLGMMRAPEAAQVLASNIALEFNPLEVPNFAYPILPQYPAMDALIKIGNPAISFLIKNLSEGDDKTVRDMSLKALCEIEDNKDVVELRLKEAVKAQSRPHERQRLQSALHMLRNVK
jgi:hypothetical protein